MLIKNLRQEGKRMAEQIKVEEIRKSILSSDTKEVTKILETLDENSKVLAKTYLSALADKQQLENAKLA